MATRILYVITKANWGGAQHYVYDLAAAAQAAGHRVRVAVGGTGPLSEKLTAEGIRVIPLTSLKQKRTFLSDLLSFSSLFSLIRIMREERPDIVHTNSAKAGGLGALTARLVGIPRIIFTAHGWEFNAPRSWLSRLGIRLFSWLTVLLSHTTICVSDAVRRDMVWMPYTRKKLVVIHNGIACRTPLSREEARAVLAPHSVGKYWIGMISELHPTKRIEDAIHAMKIIAEAHPEAILVVIGEGRERVKLEDLIRELHLRNHVSLAGFHRNTASLLSAFDLFVHSSQSEALGFVLLEAGCASLPVVATKVGGIPEIILDDDHGILVPPRNPEALATAIESLMKDPSRAHELGARLHARVLHSFSLEKMMKKTINLYSISSD